LVRRFLDHHSRPGLLRMDNKELLGVPERIHRQGKGERQVCRTPEEMVWRGISNLPVAFDPGFLTADLAEPVCHERRRYRSHLQGAIVTVTLSLIGILIGLPIGLGRALIRWANVPVAARIVALYVTVQRATPLVTLLLLLFFALPNIGVPMTPISAAILGLVMNTSAFNCEVWLSALMNFPRDQYEAAQSVGMRAGQRFAGSFCRRSCGSAFPVSSMKCRC